VITLSNVVGSKWGHAPLGVGLEGASTHFIQTFKNAFFSRNLGQNMLKNAYLLKKSCKIAAASRDPPQKSTLASSSWSVRLKVPALLLSLIDIIDINLSKRVLAF